MECNKLISVVLPVYNCELYIKEAVLSILNQSYTKFELIVVNDGSTDSTLEILNSFADERLKIITQNNEGIVRALNKGLELCNGDYIARQDADDISYPDRLQKQLEFLEKNKEIYILGSWAEIINDKSELKGVLKHHTKVNELRFWSIFDTYFVHSTIMFRKEIIEYIGNYKGGKHIFEDFNLWSRILRFYKGTNLPCILLKYRELNTGISKSTSNFKERIINQRIENLLFYNPNINLRILFLLSNYQFGLQKLHSLKELKELKLTLLNINKVNFENDLNNINFINEILNSYTFFVLHKKKDFYRTILRMIDKIYIHIVKWTTKY